MSHAAGTFTVPPGCANAGGAAPARDAIRSAAAALTIGLVKNEPALRLSGSASSITMPLRRRIARTAARTSATVGCVTPARSRAAATSA